MLKFLIHLRLHYQFFILSGGYLMGGLLVPDPEWNEFWLQFLNVHVLLFGGATVFNSWHDKDEGPIGGLQNPPKMKKWMRDASIFIQILGFILAWNSGLIFTLFYLLSMTLFWLYSTPHARWKGKPLLSLVAIGVSTGSNSLVMGALAAGADFSLILLTAGIGAGFMMLSLYPVSQIYQVEEDTKRGDFTFASVYGLKGVRWFNSISFILGVVILGLSIYFVYQPLSIVFLIAGVIVWVILMKWVQSLSTEKDQYREVMQIKYIVSGIFVLFIVTALIIRHL
jgi:4-hydroxybenzoate polyprenyltransferase